MKSQCPDHMDLLCKKGLYLYGWLNYMTKRDYAAIPPIGAFYSTLKKAEASD